MPLTGAQAQKLRDALLMGLPKPQYFEEFAWFGMNIRLWEVVPLGELAAVAFNLVTWCDSQGRAGELLTALARARPHHRTIQEVIAALCAELGLPWPGEVLALPPAAPPTAAPRGVASPAAAPPDVRQLMTRVRAQLRNLYPNREKLILLVNDYLAQDYDEIVETPSPDMEILKLVRWADKDRAFRLRPLLAAVLAQHPDAQDLAKVYQELDRA